jgi:cell division protein FtsN
MKRNIHQHGSTTLGIIVGILLGLAVALGVSLYLATSGAPVQTKAANPAARIEPPVDPSKAPDPNQSLYTKVPKTEEAKDPNKDPKLEEAKAAAKAKPEADAKPEAKTDSKPESKPDTKPELKAEAKPEAKPTETVKPPAASKPEQDAIGKIAATATPAAAVSAASSAASAAASAAAAAAKASAAATASAGAAVPMPKTALPNEAGERYFVQAGAFANVTDAEAVKARLALLGVSMALSPRERDGQVLQRVRTAPLAAVDAEKLRNTLKANGIETSLVKVQ